MNPRAVLRAVLRATLDRTPLWILRVVSWANIAWPVALLIGFLTGYVHLTIGWQEHQQ